MKRLHIHVGVESIEDSIKFYAALFGAAPVKTKPDYAKWMLDDPRVNFAISTRARKKGVDHLGIQVDDASELEALRAQMSAANIATHDEGETTCCYAKSEKSWVEDPSGIAWETYHTMEDAQVFSAKAQGADSACCVPEAQGENVIAKTGCCPTPKEAVKKNSGGCCG